MGAKVFALTTAVLAALCETLLIVVELTAEQEKSENADADTEADG